MKKIKDIFYDMNDVLVALIILAVAAVIITTNIESILNYPSSIAAGIEVPEQETPTNYAENPPVEEPEGNDAAADQDDQQTQEDQGDQQTQNDQGAADAGTNDQNNNDGGGVSGNTGTGAAENYSITINPGSTGTQIADILVGVGLFENRQEFISAITAAGAEGKLRAGSFRIPSDATPAEVISIITNP